MIITQKLIRKQLPNDKKSLKEIKHILGRERLKYSLEEIAFYLYQIFLHQSKMVYFKKLFKKAKKRKLIDVNYSTYMNNILVVSKLMGYLEKKFAKYLKIKPSRLINIVDTTILETKQEKHITKKDLSNNMVTRRTNSETKQKYSICGYKVLMMIDRHNKIYHYELLNINTSDQNIFKDSARYTTKLGRFLLADSGFNNQVVCKRLSSINTTLISPNHHKQRKKLGFILPKFVKIYKKRWPIEIVFKDMKAQYGEIKFNLKGAKHYSIIKAKMIASIAQFNFLNIK